MRTDGTTRAAYSSPTGKGEAETHSLETSAYYFREKAAQCRRLARGIVVQDDPAVDALLALAAEFESKAEEATRHPPQ